MSEYKYLPCWSAARHALVLVVVALAVAGCKKDDKPEDVAEPQTPVSAPVNNPPQITGKPSTSVLEGKAYSFKPSASDPDGQALTFSIAGKPGWASFNKSTGQLSGTPAKADVGVNTGIVISVSDGAATASLPAFEITVEAVNHMPTIAGTPASSVVEGQAYDFKPSASDPDGDALTFSIKNKPSWASFSNSTGRLSGKPGAGTAGNYANIVITVSDGQAQASLPAFSIAVQQVATGSATLSWTAPTMRTDGTPLTNLAGYKIHYGTSPGSYPNKITLDNPGLTSYVVENLAQGTWYFSMTSFDTAGAESDYSAASSKSIQ